MTYHLLQVSSSYGTKALSVAGATGKLLLAWWRLFLFYFFLYSWLYSPYFLLFLKGIMVEK